MQRKLLLISFIEGAAVMAAELCGAKLLAPIFGSSLYVWASVMGITLAALASGYFYGGWITERSKEHNRNLFRVLTAASLFVLAMPLISHYLVPRISYLPFLPGVVTSTLALLFLPVFFLGATSPLFIILQTNETNSAGKVSGTVYAVSTAGGILATFLCGFYLIPSIGLSFTLLIFGGLLFAVTIFIFKIIKIAHLLILAGFVYLNLQFLFPENNSIESSESILGKLQVQDVVNNDEEIRLLKINDIVQTEMDLQSKKSVSGYINLLDSIIFGNRMYNEKPDKEALVLGLGGGLAANLLVNKNFRVTGVEFDERIVDAAKNFFFLDTTVEVHCQDARDYLNHCDKKYDAILFDVFKAEEQPGHVLTLESLKRIKEKNLNFWSFIYINWHGYTDDELGKGTAILRKTLDSAGFYTEMYSLSNDPAYRNIIFRCREKWAGRVIFRRYPKFYVNDTLAETTIVNTDDKPVLEKYNALANKAWRSNYLRYYQNK
ncbi:MAG: hypothetical protein K0S32_150 [Bacteroidetes bacterium]|jgi:predicted membrane-bound spermidine synthase|nr:hypothetical protein [Bacteroidota bacterium]